MVRSNPTPIFFGESYSWASHQMCINCKQLTALCVPWRDKDWWWWIDVWPTKWNLKLIVHLEIFQNGQLFMCQMQVHQLTANPYTLWTFQSLAQVLKITKTVKITAWKWHFVNKDKKIRNLEKKLCQNKVATATSSCVKVYQIVSDEFQIKWQSLAALKKL